MQRKGCSPVGYLEYPISSRSISNIQQINNQYPTDEYPTDERVATGKDQG
jgi:hypothetical protein